MSTKRGVRRLVALVVGLGVAGVAIGWRFGGREAASSVRARR